MKRILIVVAAVMALTLAFAAPAFAGTAYSNAKADLEPVPGRGVDNASGQAVINYAKGQQKLLTNGTVINLLDLKRRI